jgi:hypothetical protein
VRACRYCGRELTGHGTRRACEAAECQKKKVAAYNRAYYQANREKQAERQRAYRQANREKQAERQRAYYQANREKLAERQRAYYQANREKLAERQRAYYQANREKLEPINYAQRECLSCGRQFKSFGRHNRICGACKTRQAAYGF